jgi:integrase/recombinase XerD
MLNSLAVRKPQDIIGDGDITKTVDDWHTALDLMVGSGDISETTSRTYRKGMEKFLAWCELASISGVDSDTLQSWKAALIKGKAKPGAINAWLSGVRSFYRWALAAHRTTYNPAQGVKGARRLGTSKKHKREILTDLEARRTMAQPDVNTDAGLRDRAILFLFLFTAVRTIEVHRAKVEDLHTIGNKMVLDVTGKGSTESDELVVIESTQAQEALYDWLAVRGKQPGALFTSLSDRSHGQPLSLQAIRAIVKGYMKSAGVTSEKKTTHSLRHTAITSAIRHGATPMQARAMARHKSLDTTMIYFHETDRLANPAESFISYDDEK